jgi:signal peptidase II
VKSIITAAVVVLADQLTKLAIVKEFMRGEQIAIWEPVLRLGHARNSGAVFGIMRGAGRYFMVFSLAAALVLAVVIFVARRTSTPVRVGLGLVLGGALGNLIDRLRFGAVVDFIDIGVNNRIRWPSFNVADLAITVGVVMLIAASLKAPRHECTSGAGGKAF